MLLQDDDDACGRRSLLEGVVWALPSIPSRATGETLDLLVQAVASLLRRSLGGGAVRVARGVPFWPLEPRSAATWSVGVLSAMYTGANLAWTALSLGLVTSCSSLADL
jgi:hypothetical protein